MPVNPVLVNTDVSHATMYCSHRGDPYWGLTLYAHAPPMLALFSSATRSAPMNVPAAPRISQMAIMSTEFCTATSAMKAIRSSPQPLYLLHPKFWMFHAMMSKTGTLAPHLQAVETMCQSVTHLKVRW